eukprot:scaffold28580_cov66-Skeletonema_marinoi.AAC.1
MRATGNRAKNFMVGVERVVGLQMLKNPNSVFVTSNFECRLSRQSTGTKVAQVDHKINKQYSLHHFPAFDLHTVGDTHNFAFELGTAY